MSEERIKTPFEREGLPTAVMDAREAAAYLAVKVGTIYRMVRAGELPHVRVGRNIRFRIKDLNDYLEERTSRTWQRVDGRGRPSKAAGSGGGNSCNMRGRVHGQE